MTPDLVQGPTLRQALKALEREGRLEVAQGPSQTGRTQSGGQVADYRHRRKLK